MISLKKILVPTDFEATSQVAVNYARALAEAFGASIHVLHVLEDPMIHAASHEYFTPQPNYREAMEGDAHSRLRGQLNEEQTARFRAQFVARWGIPFVEIIRYAKDENVDLIVMGTHGLGVIAHILMGSVAEKVVRKAPCPVLIVRHPEHEFVMP
jgi:nucleotide-binding universal stress UspA family protein